ncbi:hypothetical protein Btru_073433 [Bulinus truncatus]|nr:hypothetical protein Btru_073433 [Bulinus truncatus]
MKEISPIHRQVTFNTELGESDVFLGNNLQRGSIQIPVVTERDIKVKNSPASSLGHSRRVGKASSTAGYPNEVVTEAAPSLSLSIRKKLKKKPRIRVPTLSFNTREPTIEEETDQDSTASSRLVQRESSREAAVQRARTNTVIAANSKQRKAETLSLSPKELPQEKKKQSNEVTIVEYPTGNKSSAQHDSKTFNIQLRSNNETLNKNQSKHSYSESDPYSLSNIYTDKQGDRQNNHSESVNYRKIPALNKQSTDTYTEQNSRTLPSNMAERRNYNFEHETFEEVLQDRNSLAKSEKTYHKRIRQLEDELQAIVIQCQALSDENKELRKLLDSAKQENPEHKKKVDALHGENSKLKLQNEELEKQISALEKQLVVKGQSESRVSELLMKNREVESKLTEIQKENGNFKLKITALEDKNQIISTTLEEKRKELHELMRTMKQQPAMETKLKESNHKLEDARREMEKIKNDLIETNQLLKNSELMQEKLKENISEKEREMAKMKKSRETDQKLITDLKTKLDESTDKLKKSESKKETFKDLENETTALKSRIAFLTTESDSTAAENVRLKHEREELNRHIDRLNDVCSVNANVASENKKILKKLESEREGRIKAEAEISQKDRELRNIEKRVKEAELTIQELRKKIDSLEEENEMLKAMDIIKLGSDNKSLKKENKKLRQMLVERNIELTNKKAELANEKGGGQILFLQRKSKLSKVGVQKVPDWSADESGDKPKVRSVTFSSDERFLNHPSKSRKFARQHSQEVSPQSQSADVIRASVKKNVRSSATTDKDDVETRRSINLPPVIDTSSESIAEHQAGYFNLYKDKLKRMKDLNPIIDHKKQYMFN